MVSVGLRGEVVLGERSVRGLCWDWEDDVVVVEADILMVWLVIELVYTRRQYCEVVILVWLTKSEQGLTASK